MTISELMKEQQLKFNMSQEDVGRAVGVNRATVQRWENGIINIDRKHIRDICNTLHIDPVIFCHPNEVIFPDERRLIESWRKADELTKELVRRTLHIEEEKNDSLESTI